MTLEKIPLLPSYHTNLGRKEAVLYPPEKQTGCFLLN